MYLYFLSTRRHAPDVKIDKDCLSSRWFCIYTCASSILYAFAGARADLNVARATENLDLALKQQRASKGELVGHLDFDENGGDGFADSSTRAILQR
jgi:hypothetical protein